MLVLKVVSLARGRLIITDPYSVLMLATGWVYSVLQGISLHYDILTKLKLNINTNSYTVKWLSYKISVIINIFVLIETG